MESWTVQTFLDDTLNLPKNHDKFDMTTATASQNKKITVYYDGLCNLCSGVMDTVSTSSIGSEVEHKDISKDQLPEGITKEAAMHDVHVIDADGHMYKGADAVIKIFEQYPRLRWLAAIGRLPGIHLLAKGIYRVVEKTRYAIFGRKQVS